MDLDIPVMRQDEVKIDYLCVLWLAPLAFPLKKINKFSY